MMRLYSIVYYRRNMPNLYYIVKAENQNSALSFLQDHLKGCEGWLGTFAFFERYFEVGLFDTYDPEIIEILSRELYDLKYSNYVKSTF